MVASIMEESADETEPEASPVKERTKSKARAKAKPKVCTCNTGLRSELTSMPCRHPLPPRAALTGLSTAWHLLDTIITLQCL
jgi:hypothetical protein